MTFSISNLTSCFYSQEHPKCQKVSDATTVMTDLIFTIGLVVVGGLILGGVLNAGIPGGISWAMIAAGGGIVLIDGASLIVRSCLQYLRHSSPQIEGAQETISEDAISSRSTHNIDTSTCHKIEGLEGSIFIGDCFAFGETLLDNPHNFHMVITMCPTFLIAQDSLAHNIKLPPPIRYEKILADKGVNQWHYLGDRLGDHQKYWNKLVYRCTFPTDLSLKQWQKAQVPRYYLPPKFHQLHPKEWFEPTFQFIDECIAENQNILIHCQRGRSRSVAVLCAYLIKRHQKTPQEAITLIQQCRQQAHIEIFGEELQKYYDSLYSLDALD